MFFSEINAQKEYSLIGKLYLLKSVFFIVFILLVVYNIISFEYYTKYQLLIPELIIYLIFLFMMFKNHKVNYSISFIKYFKRDILFGLKSFWGTLFFEASVKVDLLLLGVFVSPAKVGVFSIISIMSDLFLNICTVLRTIVNPDITYNYLKSKEQFKSFIIKKSVINYKILVPIIAGLVLFFYSATLFIPKFSNYQEGLIPLIILFSFLALVSGYLPLMLTFGQIGKPNFQSLNFFILFIFNVGLNYVLIPIYGLLGAAIATGLAYMVYVLFFRKALNYLSN